MLYAVELTVVSLGYCIRTTLEKRAGDLRIATPEVMELICYRKRC